MVDYSRYDLTPFGPKDKKIIKDNPGRDLMGLAGLGLSDKAYARLTDMQADYEKQIASQKKTPEPEQPADTSPIIKPVTVTPVVVRSQPATRLSSSNVGSTSCWVHNASTGLKQYLSRSAAEKLERMAPNIYKIVG